MMNSSRTMNDALEFARGLAREAGALLLDFLGRRLEIGSKSARTDLVTNADRASERLIVQRIRERFPRAAILAEETGLHPGSGSDRWIVDPLDGTTNFAHGYPPFCVSLAYEREGELEVGLVYAPFFRELFEATRGGGASLNGRPIAVSKTQDVAEALLCTGFAPSNYARNGRYFEKMTHHAQAVRRDGSAALDLAYVAAGRFDGFWEFDLRPWDVAAGVLIVREAGGHVSGTDGTQLDLAAGSILASNGATHEQLVQLLG